MLISHLQNFKAVEGTYRNNIILGEQRDVIIPRNVEKIIKKNYNLLTWLFPFRRRSHMIVYHLKKNNILFFLYLYKSPGQHVKRVIVNQF